MIRRIWSRSRRGPTPLPRGNGERQESDKRCAKRKLAPGGDASSSASVRVREPSRSVGDGKGTRGGPGDWRGAGEIGLLLLLFCLPGCVQDMWINARVKPLAANPVFANDRSSRPLVPDTVARGHADLDPALYTGFVGGKPVTTLPVPLTRALLLRGQNRFDIYCSPCHGYSGYGDGMIVKRGFPAPPSYHIDRLRKAPIGHFFDVMTNGYGLMYSYADRVAPEDRWAIAAYIRALQRSQGATVQDVPPGTPILKEGARK